MLSPFWKGAFQKIVSVPGAVRCVYPEPPPWREMQPVSGWGQVVLGPVNPLHWIHTLGGTGGSAAAGPDIASEAPARLTRDAATTAPRDTDRCRKHLLILIFRSDSILERARCSLLICAVRMYSKFGQRGTCDTPSRRR